MFIGLPWSVNNRNRHNTFTDKVKPVSVLPSRQSWLGLCTLWGKFPSASLSFQLPQVVISLLPLALTSVASAIYNASLCEGALNEQKQSGLPCKSFGGSNWWRISLPGCLLGSWALAAASPLLLQIPIFLLLLKHFPTGHTEWRVGNWPWCLEWCLCGTWPVGLPSWIKYKTLQTEGPCSIARNAVNLLLIIQIVHFTMVVHSCALLCIVVHTFCAWL